MGFSNPNTKDDAGALEDRVVGSLIAAGIVRANPTWRLPVLFVGLILATAILAGGIGFVAGGNSVRSATAQATYAFVIYGESLGANASAEIARARIQEYDSWERSTPVLRASIAASERLVTGDLAVLGTMTPDKPLKGFYLVKAASAQQAIEMARTNPHLHYGGAIIVRTIAR